MLPSFSSVLAGVVTFVILETEFVAAVVARVIFVVIALVDISVVLSVPETVVDSAFGCVISSEVAQSPLEKSLLTVNPKKKNP